MYFRSAYRYAVNFVTVAILPVTFAAMDAPQRSGPIPVADFFRPPALNQPVVNHSGSRIAALVDGEDDLMGVRFFDLSTSKQTGIRGSHNRDIDDLRWLDDGHLLMTTTREKIYADGLFVVSAVDTSEVYAIARDSAITVVSVPTKSPMRPVVWIERDAYDDSKDRGAVQLDGKMRVDPPKNLGIYGTSSYKSANLPLHVNGTAASICRTYPEQKWGMTENYLADRHGELAYAIASDKGVESLLILRDKSWEKSPLDMDRYDVLAAGDDEGEVIAIGPRQEGKPRALVRVNAVTGKEISVLHQDQQYDPNVAAILRHPVSRLIIGVQLYRRSLTTIWFDADHEALQAELNKMFPGRLVSLMGSDEIEKHLVVAVFSDRSPVEYHFIDLEKKLRQPIADSAPWIDAEQMQPMQTLSYKTRDGLKVEGYLTLPAGATKENPAPLVVLVHGGPWARDVWDWNGEVQFLASRGYAVFQPNYRGSTGYGWTFPAGDQWQFRKMHDDVTDGVRKLIKSGLIDPQRMAIMGASFGGYLAMCGAAYEPDLYRCAITQAGVFDWAEMIKEARRNQFESIRYQFYLRNLGDPKAHSAELAEISPLNHVDQVKIPVLVAHGVEDSVVSVEQSERLVKELDRFHVPHRVLVKSGEGHGLFRMQNRVEYYTAVEAFLAEHLSPRLPGTRQISP